MPSTVEGLEPLAAESLWSHPKTVDLSFLPCLMASICLPQGLALFSLMMDVMSETGRSNVKDCL
jgi:hypothetical protein